MLLMMPLTEIMALEDFHSATSIPQDHAWYISKPIFCILDDINEKLCLYLIERLINVQKHNGTPNYLLLFLTQYLNSTNRIITKGHIYTTNI